MRQSRESNKRKVADAFGMIVFQGIGICIYQKRPCASSNASDRSDPIAFFYGRKASADSDSEFF